MKVMILLPLILCCSAAPLSNGKGRKAKQLELVVASGYSSVSRAAPYKNDLQSSVQSLNRQSSFNTKASVTATSQQTFDDISPRSSATVTNIGSKTPLDTSSVSLITDNVDSENMNIMLSNSEDIETKSSADIDGIDEISADDAKILATTVILSSVNDKTEPNVEQEVVMDTLAADNKNDEEFTALTQSLLSDETENSPSNDLTSDIQSQTIEEVKTLPFSVATPITIDEDPETPVSLLESSAVKEEAGLTDPTEVAEQATTVELIPEEINNLPTEDEAQLDEFSSSIVLDSEPLPKIEDEVSIIELVPSDAESLFDLESDIDVNDLVKRSNSEETVSEVEDEGNQNVFINPLTKPIFEALPGSGRDLAVSEIVDSELEAVIVEADEPVGTEIPTSSEAEPQIVVREAKPECIDDTLAKEDYKVAEGQPVAIEEIESEVIIDV